VEEVEEEEVEEEEVEEEAGSYREYRKLSEVIGVNRTWKVTSNL